MLPLLLISEHILIESKFYICLFGFVCVCVYLYNISDSIYSLKKTILNANA